MSFSLQKTWLSIRKRIHKLKRERYYVKKIGEAYYLLDRDNLVDRHVDAFGGYEKSQISHFLELLNKFKPDQFLDIGAHWGMYTLAVAFDPKLAAVKICAFEPDRINRSQLHANLFLNRLEDIHVYENGLSDTDTTVKFSRVANHNRGASRISDTGEFEIQVNRLDSLITPTDQKIAMKIDIEGHETEAFEGMQLLLAQNTCVIQVECYQPNAVSIMLKALGAKFHHLETIEYDHYFTNSNQL
jgi:FkbM family methyltransferase